MPAFFCNFYFTRDKEVRILKCFTLKLTLCQQQHGTTKYTRIELH